MLLIESGVRFGGCSHIKIISDDGETVLGWFDIERFPKGRKASIHSYLHPKYRGQGLGREMYDKAEKLIINKGLRFVPSPNLSPDSLRIWKRRGPEKLRNHIEREDGGASLDKRRAYF